MFICQQDDIVYPIVTANGVSVVSVRIINQVNEIATATIWLKPEDLSQFNPDQPVSINISGAPNGGLIFKGHVSAFNFSNMNGQLTAGIDLKHRAKYLDEASGLVPGLTPGGNYDIKTILFKPKSQVADGASGISVDFDVKKPFPEAICGDEKKGMIGWLTSVGESNCNGFKVADAGILSRTIEILNGIKKDSDPFKFKYSTLNKRVSKYCNGILSRAATSSTVWDLLSVIIGSFDCSLVCKPDGKVIMTPNWMGVAADMNHIDTEFITKFDLSSLTHRNIKHCRVMGSVGTHVKKNKMTAKSMGDFSMGGTATSGTMVLSAPGWINDVHVDPDRGTPEGTQKKALDSLAECILYRERDKDQTVNLITPVALDAYPGTCAYFIPASSIISFHTGAEVAPFTTEYDGYCYRTEHIMATNSWTTTFYFQTCTTKGNKVDSHPFFPGAKQPVWNITG